MTIKKQFVTDLREALPTNYFSFPKEMFLTTKICQAHGQSISYLGRQLWLDIY